MEVASECESLSHSVSHLKAEYSKMANEVDDRVRELNSANQEVSDDIEREKMLFADACRRIEQEKISFLQSMRDEFESESGDNMRAIAGLESEIGRYSIELATLKDHLIHCKVDISNRMQTVAERTTSDEQHAYAEIEAEVNQEILLINKESEDMKADEKDFRRKLQVANSKLEETRGDASRVLANIRAKLTDSRNQLRDAITEEKTLENQFVKREHQYNSYYETVEKEEREIHSLAMHLDQEIMRLAEKHEKEGLQIEEHINSGKDRLEKILYAIGEFKQENSKLVVKNERTLSNITLGLNGLIQGLVPHD